MLDSLRKLVKKVLTTMTALSSVERREEQIVWNYLRPHMATWSLTHVGEFWGALGELGHSSRKNPIRHLLPRLGAEGGLFGVQKEWEFVHLRTTERDFQRWDGCEVPSIEVPRRYLPGPQETNSRWYQVPVLEESLSSFFSLLFSPTMERPGSCARRIE